MQSVEKSSKKTLNASFLSYEKVSELSMLVDVVNSYKTLLMEKREMSSTVHFNHVVECDPEIYRRQTKSY